MGLPQSVPMHVLVSRVLQFGGRTSRTHRDISVAGVRRLPDVVDGPTRAAGGEETGRSRQAT